MSGPATTSAALDALAALEDDYPDAAAAQFVIGRVAAHAPVVFLAAVEATRESLATRCATGGHVVTGPERGPRPADWLDRYFKWEFDEDEREQRRLAAAGWAGAFAVGIAFWIVAIALVTAAVLR